MEMLCIQDGTIHILGKRFKREFYEKTDESRTSQVQKKVPLTSLSI